MAKILFICFLFALAHQSSATSNCYFPNGKNATDNFPCDPDAEQSVCCGGGLGSVCLSNKLCSNSNGNVVRGSCTDKNWASTECAMYCLGASTGGTDLISCSNVTMTDTSFCCDHVSNCCDSGVGRFEVKPSHASAWATWNVASSKYITVSTSSTSAPSSTSATTSTFTSQFSSTSATSEPSQSVRPTSEYTQDDTSSGLSVGTQAGIGAGAGVGGILIIAIAFLLWKNHKKNQIIQAKDTELPSSQWYPPSTQGYPPTAYGSSYTRVGPRLSEHEHQIMYDNTPKELENQRPEFPRDSQRHELQA